jgi:hypothetical protein
MPPFRTKSKWRRVGWKGTGCGVELKISWFGLNAVEIIQKTGKAETTNTAMPAVFRAIRRILRAVMPLPAAGP